MTHSGLQKRIREASSKVVSTDDPEEFDRVASELKAALHEHAENLRKVVDETRNRLTKKQHSGGSQS